MSTAVMSTQVVGLLPFKRQMELLAMPKATRRRLLYRVAKKVIRDSKKRVRLQRDLKGRPYEARAKKRKGGRKMLARMAKQLKVINNNSVEAVVGFSSPVLGKIASKQQHGATELMSADKLAKRYGDADRKAPATRKQAVALREAGFEIKKAKGKGKKKPTLKWITENMKAGQAGAALRYLRLHAGDTISKSWTTVLPARSFLGATPKEVVQYIDLIFKQIKQELNYAAR